MLNTLQVQVQCARPRLRIYVQSVYRSTMYTYTYSIHTQAHGLTCNMRIALAAHAKHCTRTCTVRTPKHTGLCTVASLRLPTSNTVQAQLQCARLRTRTHVQRMHRSGYPCRPLCKYKYSVRAHVHAPTHNRFIAQASVSPDAYDRYSPLSVCGG